MRLRPTKSPLFPYTTLFRSQAANVFAPLEHQSGLAQKRKIRASVLRVLCSLSSSAASLTRFHQCSSILRTIRSEEHTSELQSPYDLVCRLLLEKKRRSCSFR